MTRARLTTNRAVEYDVLETSEGAVWVLRDPVNDVRVFEESSWRERVEVRCDLCGVWTTGIQPFEDGWRCVPECASGAKVGAKADPE